jgi:DNA-binding transcriptional LysR family regulator
MAISARVFRGMDLNSLLTFLVVYHEHSVSGAAQCLSVSQPAVSNTLAKLRVYFDDPLFVREAKKVIPTNCAHDIAKEITPAFLLIQQTLLKNLP